MACQWEIEITNMPVIPTTSVRNFPNHIPTVPKPTAYSAFSSGMAHATRPPLNTFSTSRDEKAGTSLRFHTPPKAIAISSSSMHPAFRRQPLKNSPTLHARFLPTKEPRDSSSRGSSLLSIISRTLTGRAARPPKLPGLFESCRFNGLIEPLGRERHHPAATGGTRWHVARARQRCGTAAL